MRKSNSPPRKAWSKWEGDIVTLLPSPETVEHFTSPEVAVAVARIENHYMAAHGWLEEGQLLRERRKAARHPRRHRPGPARQLHAAGRRVAAEAGVARGRAQPHPRCRASVQRAGQSRRAGARHRQVRRGLTCRHCEQPKAARQSRRRLDCFATLAMTFIRQAGTPARCGPSAGRDRNRRPQIA